MGGRLVREIDLYTSKYGIHEAHVILKRICNGIQGFEGCTLGHVLQFEIMSGPFIQIDNINNNHWICFSSIHSPPFHV